MKQLPHERFIYWFSQKSRRTKIGLICAVVLVTLSLCICSAMASTTTAKKHTTQAAPTQVTSVQQTTPVATATTVPPTFVPTKQPTVKLTQQPTQAKVIATYGTPHLGGPISDFIGKYGQPSNDTSDQSYHWFRDSTSNVDGLIAWTLTHQNKVDSLDVQAINGDMPDLTSAIALCTIYNPSDAHQLKNIPLVDATGKASGFDVVYLSNILAQTFAAGDFSDGNSNTVQRGSFDIQYLYKSDGTQSIDSCSIQLGQQQTTG